MTDMEAVVLLKLIPGLGPILEVLTNFTTISPSSLEELESLQEAKLQFHLVFRKFIKIVSTSFPLVWMMDDCQWADSASLEILKPLVEDEDLAHTFLLVGCYRDDEVNNEQHELTKLQNAINSLETIQTLHINLQSLSLESLNNLMAKLLNLDYSPDQTLPITELCYKKTGGNAFFFVRFVLSLLKDKMITYSLVANGWEWDLSEIARNANVQDNVVVFLKKRIGELPSVARHALLFASCLGTEFSLEALSIIFQDFYPQQPFMKEVELCVNEGILDPVSGGNYRWVHDKLVEAAQSLVEDAAYLPKLKFCIGEILLTSLDKDGLEEGLFVVVNLLNEAPLLYSKPKHLAELNLKAAQKAASLSAFDAASGYCTEGIAVIPSDSKWTAECFDLTLALYTTAAKTFSTLGNYEAMEPLCHEVLSNENVSSILDKVPLHVVLMDSLCYRNRMVDCLDMCLGMLQKLGISFPKGKIRIIFRTIMGLKKHKGKVDQLIPKLQALSVVVNDDPISERRTQYAVSLYLKKLCKYTIMAKSPLAVLAPLAMMKYSLQNGQLPYTAMNTAVIGMMVSEFGGDIAAGAKYATLALELAHQYPKKQELCQVIMMSYGFVLHHTKPIHEMQKPLLKGYNLAISYGDTEHACYCIYSYVVLAFRMGKGLPAIESDLREYTKQIRQFRIDKVLNTSLMLWQMVMNLMGFPNTSPLILTGEAMREEEMLDEISDVYLAMLQAHQSHLYALFGEHKQGADLSLSKMEMQRVRPGSPYTVLDACFRAISLFAMARTTKKRKYKQAAKQLKGRVDGWAKNGDPNVVHFKSLLTAELLALEGKHREAIQEYEAAIVTASRLGFVQDAALFNGRLAEFFELDFRDPALAKHRYREAIKLYTDWGANAKVSALMEKKGWLLGDGADKQWHPTQVVVKTEDDKSTESSMWMSSGVISNVDLSRSQQNY